MIASRCRGRARANPQGDARYRLHAEFSGAHFTFTAFTYGRHYRADAELRALRSLVEALENTLNTQRYSLLVATCEYDQRREAEQIQLLLQRGADGIVLIGENRSAEAYAMLDHSKVPYIINYVFNNESSRACVGFDNFSATVRATRYLLSIGHKRIGVLAGITKDNDRTTARLEGVRATLAAAGLKLPQKRIVESQYGIENGRQRFENLSLLHPT